MRGLSASGISVPQNFRPLLTIGKKLKHLWKTGAAKWGRFLKPNILHYCIILSGLGRYLQIVESEVSQSGVASAISISTIPTF